MTEYYVPITFEVTGELKVDTKTKEQAIEKARELWFSKKTNEERFALISPITRETDFAYGDDPEEVFEADDEEDPQ